MWREADFLSMWKVINWKLVNTRAFPGTEPESFYFYITDQWATNRQEPELRPAMRLNERVALYS
jgi:hypothetical protein